MLEPLTEADPRSVGRYQLQGRLGVGGMGAVYLGFDGTVSATGGSKRRAVAVKVVRPDLLGDPEFRDRFRHEVAAARRVRGSCVARVLDADVDAASPWMATEYVDGVSLHAAVVRRGALSGPMVVGLASGLANALVAVHEAGLVHRDLKPSNVLLAWDGPKIIDFGIARALDSTSNTATGSLLGTVAWMAPEQLRGERAGPAADVFAWALCVAFGAQGRHAYPAEAPAATAIRMLQEPPDLAGVPEHLIPLLVRALDRDPLARPSAVELVSELAGVAVGGVAEADAAARGLIVSGWDAPTPPGLGAAPVTEVVHPTQAAGSNGAGSNGAGTNSAGTNSAGTNSAGTNSAGSNSAGSNGAGSNGAGTNSAGTNSGAIDGHGEGRRARLAAVGAAAGVVVLVGALLAMAGVLGGGGDGSGTGNGPGDGNDAAADLRAVGVVDDVLRQSPSPTTGATAVPGSDPGALGGPSSALVGSTLTTAPVAGGVTTSVGAGGSVPTPAAGPASPPAAATPTAKPPAAAPPPPKPAYPPTVAWQRYYNGTEHTSLTSDPGGSFHYEHTLGYLFSSGEATGTSPVYTCLDGNESFTSLRANCEGRTVVARLGWLFTAQPADIATQPIYRCRIGGDHFDSARSNCEGQTVEGPLGYVVVR